MSKRFSARWLAVLVIAAALVASGAPAHAAPAQQNVVTIVVFAYVDVAGNPGPGYPAPACNLEFDPDDEAFAQANPLPPMEFVLRDGSGVEIERQTTSELATLQRARFEGIADRESFVLQLTAPPSGWQLCPQQQADRTLTQADFSLQRARVTYHFFRPDLVTPGPDETVVPTTPPPAPVTPTVVVPTVTPGGPTVTMPPPPPPPVRPTLEPRPTAVEDRRGEREERYVQPSGCTGLGAIKGLAFIDLNADGKLGPGEPGLNDVEVRLHGGGLQLSAITPASGQFSFEALGAGMYDVFISPGPEWRITTPSRYAVTVDCNVVMGYDFGLIRHSDVPAGAPLPPLPAPGAGIRLPDTGVSMAGRAPVFGGLGFALALLALTGLTLERWRSSRP